MKQKDVTFLKKSNQKTFAPLRAVVKTPLTKNQKSFFASFCSQKEVVSFLQKQGHHRRRLAALHACSLITR